MSWDIVLEMPTDLRSSVSPFTVDPPGQDDTQRKRLNITDLTVNISSSYKPHLRGTSRTPSRWRTTEFFIYYCIFILAVPIMTRIPVSLSSCALRPAFSLWAFIWRLCSASHPNYPLYKKKLSPGWLFGRKVVSSTLTFRIPSCKRLYETPDLYAYSSASWMASHICVLPKQWAHSTPLNLPLFRVYNWRDLGWVGW